MRLPGPKVVHGRRGLVIAVSIFVAHLLGLAGRVEEWLGSWRQTEVYGSTALILGAPAAAAVAAWVVASGRRRGVAALTSAASRYRWRIHLRTVVEVWAWAAAGAGTAGLVALGWTAMQGPYGRPTPWPWVVVLAAYLLACAGGACVGHWLPPGVAPLVAATATYVLIGFAEVRAPGVLAAVTPFDSRDMTFFMRSWWVYLLQAAALGGSLSRSCCGWPGGRGTRSCSRGSPGWQLHRCWPSGTRTARWTTGRPSSGAPRVPAAR